VRSKRYVVLVDERELDEILKQGLAEKWISLDEFKNMLPTRGTDALGLSNIVPALEEFFEIYLG